MPSSLTSPARGSVMQPSGPTTSLACEVGTAGKIHRDLVAFAQAVLFVGGGLKVAQSFQRIGSLAPARWPGAVVLRGSLQLGSRDGA